MPIMIIGLNGLSCFLKQTKRTCKTWSEVWHLTGQTMLLVPTVKGGTVGFLKS